MKRREAVRRIAAALTDLYDPREAAHIARLTVCSLGNISLGQLLAEPDTELRAEGIDRATEELLRGRPVQYVLGTTEFCGLTLVVREGVLIPRPETEELVRWVAGRLPARARILDVGTGSGCIALALKHLLPEASVTAVDRSPEALAVARENAARLRLDVAFTQSDALAGLLHVEGPFDALVSNPPYVPASDRAAMHPNVRDYEPSEALFVPDDDPLLFYRALARAGHRLLAPEGGLWFEIYEHAAEGLADLLRREGYAHTQLRRDLNAKPRMLWTRR